MTFRQLQTPCLGIHIEGLGDSTGSDGFVLYHGTAPSSTGNYTFLEHLIDPPMSVSSSIDIYDGSFSLDAFSFKIALNSTTAALFLKKNQDRDLLLADAADSTDTTIDVSPKGISSVGDILFIGNETMRVTTVNTSPSSYDTLTVTRGYAKSLAEDHALGANVYRETPHFLKDRIVTLLWTGDPSDSIETRWLGILQNVRVVDETHIVIETASLLMALSDAKANRRHSPIPVTDTFYKAPFGTRGVLEVERGRSYAVPQSSTAYLQVGERLVKATKKDTRLEPDGTYLGGFFESEDYDKDDPRFEEGTQAIEVIYLDVDDGENSYAGCDHPRHVLSIVLAHLVSTGEGTNNPTGATYDVLSADWALGIPADHIEVADFTDLISERPGDTLDRLLLGWDGEAVDLWEMLRDLMRSYGYTLYPTNEGKIGVTYLEPFSISKAAEIVSGSQYASLIPQDIEIDHTLDQSLTSVTGEVGETPWSDPDRITVTADDREDNRNRAVFGRGSGTSYDFSHLYRRSLRRARALLFEQLRWRASSPPVLRAMMTIETSSGQLPALGQWVRIQGGPELGVYGPGGTQIVIDDNASLFCGLLISKRVDWESSTASCDVLLLNWRFGSITRLLAPSGVIDSTGTDMGTFYIDLDSSEYPSVNATSGFAAGDEVFFTYEDGRPFYSTTFLTIAAVTGGGYRLEMTAAPPDIPTAGMIVRLAGYDDFSNDSWTGSALFDSPEKDYRYCYIADEALELGLSNDPGHRYG